MNILKSYFKGYHKQGGIKEVLIIALPMIISTAADGFMTFTDRFFMAKISPEQMNAVMGGGIAVQVLTFFFVGLLGYSTALVAQYFGAGEKHNSSKTLTQAVIISLIAWPIVVLLSPIMIKYFYYMKIPQEQIAFQIEYFNVLVLGAVLALLRHTMSCYFSGIGKTGVVMWSTIVAMLVNVLLDYILIFGNLGFKAYGIKGAAIASIAGSGTGLIILAIVYLHKTNRIAFSVLKSFKFDFNIMRKLIHYGYPAGLELFLNFIAFSVMISLFHAQGEVQATAATIMFNWDLVSFIPLLGLEIAVTSLVGRYMGANRPQVAHRATISAIRIGLIYSGIIFILFISVPELLVRIFEPHSYSEIFELALPYAKNMIMIASIYVLSEALMVSFVGALRGAGDTFFTMIASVTAHWLFIPILYFSTKYFNFSIEWSWLFIVLSFLLFSSLMYFRFKSEKWKKIKILA